MATVAPIQYQVPAAPMGGGLMQGLKLGMTYQQMVAAQQEQAMKQEQMRQAVERQRQTQMALQRSFVKPIDQWTAEDVTTITTGLPEKQLGVFRDFVTQRSDTQNANLAKFYGQTLSAVKTGRSDLAAQMFEDRASGETDPNEQAVLRGLAKVSREAPDAAGKQIAMLLAGSGKFGKDYIDALKTIFKEPAEQGRMISTPEDKRAAGLVNDKGAPLPGTFFQEPGKEPKLVTGEKPKDQFVTTNAKGLAEKFGITGAEPGLYKINTATNEVSAVGRGGTTVNMRAEGPPPPGWQYERDAQGNVVKMAPIPGGPAAAKLAAQERAQTATEAGRLQAATIVVDDIKALTDLLDIEAKATGLDKANPYVQVTGVTGKTGEGLPGSARAAAQGLLDSVKANIGFEQLNKMRQESPTGGALGNITEQELKFLQSTLGTLNLDLPQAVLRRNLKRVQEVYDAVMRKAAAYPNAAQYGFGTGAPAAAPAAAPVATPAAVPTPAMTTRALPTQGAIDYLRRNPSLRGAFDEKYGPGMADRILGGQ